MSTGHFHGQRRLDGKICIVTRADLPLRAVIARKFQAEGARLVLTGPSDATDSILKDRDCAFDVDLTTPNGWQDLVAGANDAFGSIDVLVQGLSAGYVSPIAATDLSAYRAVNRENIEAAFLGVQAAMAAMRASGGGSIVHLSSVFGRTGAADRAAFVASANGLTMMAKAAGIEGAQGENKVRVNALTIGPQQDDPVTSGLMPVHKTMPAGPAQPVSADDVAEAAIFLASDKSAYVTGTVLPVDGCIGGA